MRALSIGLLLTDGKQFLGCHSTGNKFYDLPKGAAEAGETPLQTCVRETKEETGFTVDPGELLELGLFSYNKQKDLHLFALQISALPAPGTLICSSMFLHPYKRILLPEVDGYAHIPFADASSYMTANMAKVIGEARLRLTRLIENG